MKDKLMILLSKRRIKLKQYTSTLTSSWKKHLHKLELDILDGRINAERYKRKHL